MAEDIMEITLDYGRDGLPVNLPAEAVPTIIRKPAMALPADPDAEIDAALDNPIGTEPLNTLAVRANSACIVICDITRPVPNGMFLQKIIRRLMAAGIAADAITVLVATGLHRPNLGDELAELVGDPWVLDTVRVVNHDARDDIGHVRLGRTVKHDCPVAVDRMLMDADLKIATGLVEPHFMAGFSGGRKVIAPGLAHADTIRTFHSHAFMSDPAADNCNLTGNPLHEEQLQIVERIGGAYALNTVIDEDRNLSFVNFGEITSSHRVAVSFIENYCRVELPRHFETVVTSAAGYPLDKTYYQTVKGMVGALNILAPGGNLIVASECGEGLGSPEYQQAQQRLIRLGASGFLDSITGKPLAAIDEWQTQMQTKAMTIGSVKLYSSLSDADRRLTGVECVDDLNEVVRRCIDASSDRRVAVIPEGPYVIPYASSRGTNGGLECLAWRHPEISDGPSIASRWDCSSNASPCRDPTNPSVPSTL